jgi:transcriptional regulator with XRE-family HTH domain
MRQAEIHMALIDCATPQDALPLAAVTKNTEAQRRLRGAGLNQKQLAALLDTTENTISRQMKGESPLSGYVLAFVDAWEIMGPEGQAEYRDRLAKRRARKL